MDRFSIFLRRTLGAAALLLGFALVACGDDPVTPGPAGSSQIGIMHANPGYTPDVNFKNDTAQLGRLSYGTVQKATLGNGSRSIDVRATDGSVLSTSAVTLDSTVSAWVIFTGNGTDKTAFTISTKKPTLDATNAFVRIVNASKNLDPVTVKVGSLAGLPLSTTAIGYKSVMATYVALPPSTTTQLVVVTGTNTEKLTIDLTGKLQIGKAYTIVLYGSTDAAADPSVQLKSQVVQD